MNNYYMASLDAHSINVCKNKRKELKTLLFRDKILPDMMESIINCMCFDKRSAFSMAASDKYEDMFLDNSLLPLCKNLTATGRARRITSFLL